MMHKAWSSIEEVPYCIARSFVKFQGRTALKIIQFDPDWAFLDCNLSLNSPMGTKWCTKLEVAWKRCPIVLQGHPSNFTVTRSEKLTIWIQFEITRPVAAIKSLRFALFFINDHFPGINFIHRNVNDDVIKWKHFPRYWPFVRRIHRSPLISPHKGQWRRALMFSLIYAFSKRLSKQWWGWWFETPSHSLWRHCNVEVS